MENLVCVTWTITAACPIHADASTYAQTAETVIITQHAIRNAKENLEYATRRIHERESDKI